MDAARDLPSERQRLNEAAWRPSRPELPYLPAVFLLVVEALLLVVPVLVLGAIFDFPDILREPAGDVLTRFNENPGPIRTAYYFFMLSSVVLIPIAVLLHQILTGGRSSALMNVATAFGVLTGMAQVLGFIRWPILMPFLADTFADPQSSPATRDAVLVTYESFSRYSGMAVGEHLGWVFTALWLGLISVEILRHPTFPRWMGLVGIATAIAFLVNTLEQFQIGAEDAFGLLNIAVNLVYDLWLIALAVVLFKIRSRSGTADRP